MRHILVLLVLNCILNVQIISQQDTLAEIKKQTNEISKTVDTLSKSVQKNLETTQKLLKIQQSDRPDGIKFGLSVGYRYVFDKKEELIEPSISPLDSALYIDNTDWGALILSGVVMINPLKNAKWLGFMVNVNLVEFTAENVSSIFNKVIAGGFGFVFRFNEFMSIGLTYEAIYNRSLRQNIADRIGKKIMDGSNTVLTLSKDDDRYFRDNYLNGGSIKLIYNF